CVLSNAFFNLVIFFNAVQNKWNRLKHKRITAVNKKERKKRHDDDAPFDNSPTVVRLLESILSELKETNAGIKEMIALMKTSK
ncbi:hypothetical protein A2U01_0025892, partial [Trifolium medium]|nr:hypothetical protein [Trifolium medium]